MSYFSPEPFIRAMSGYNGRVYRQDLRVMGPKGSNYRGNFDPSSYPRAPRSDVPLDAVDVEFKEYEGKLRMWYPQYCKNLRVVSATMEKLRHNLKNATVRPNTLVNSDNSAIRPLILMFVKSVGNTEPFVPGYSASFSGMKLLIPTTRNLFWSKQDYIRVDEIPATYLSYTVKHSIHYVGENIQYFIFYF